MTNKLTNKIASTTLATLALTTALLSQSLIMPSAHASDISFEISGVKGDGKLYVQLFKGEQNYQRNNADNATIVKAKSGITTVSFADVDEGEYALRFFHDEDGNGKMATNLFGMPTEGYGFSNNAKPNFGPVAYSEIKFVVADNEKIINKTEVIY